jgi:hypothetical protein
VRWASGVERRSHTCGGLGGGDGGVKSAEAALTCNTVQYGFQVGFNQLIDLMLLKGRGCWVKAALPGGGG